MKTHDDKDKETPKKISEECQKLFSRDHDLKIINYATESVDSVGNNRLDVAQRDKNQLKDKEGQSKTGEITTDKNNLREKEPKMTIVPFFIPVSLFASNIHMFVASEIAISPGILYIFKSQKQIIVIVTPDSITYHDLKVCLDVEISRGISEEPDFDLLLKYLSTFHTETREGLRSKILEAFDLRRFRVVHERELSRWLYHRYSYNELLNPRIQSVQENMRNEAWRLRSFQGVDTVVSPLCLVAAGFYATGDGDETRCFSCGISYRNWTNTDNPFHIHAAISPRCNHVTGTDDDNVSIQRTTSEHPAGELSPLADDTSDGPVQSTPSPQKPVSKYKENTNIFNELLSHKDVDINVTRQIFDLVGKKDYSEEETEETKCFSQGLVIGDSTENLSSKKLKSILKKLDKTDYSGNASKSSTPDDVRNARMGNDSKHELSNVQELTKLELSSNILILLKI